MLRWSRVAVGSPVAYRLCMAERESIDALKNMLAEVELLLTTTAPLPENRTPRCVELLRAASALADDLRRATTGRA
jgi:hypothetical protein